MRAFTIDGYRQPLQAAEVPEPTVGDRDVLIRISAAGLNQLDERIRTGAFKQLLPYRTPLTLGHDLAGTVIRVGSQVRDLSPGDAVYARPRDHRIGTFAERIAVDAADVARAPSTITEVEAASLPLVALTAWQALVERGRLQAGQRVLIHSGGGGVGTIAIQLAKHLGAHVATTVSARSIELVRELGADEIVDYRAQDFAAELSGYDLVLDGLGGGDLERSLRVLRPGGLAIGISGPPTPAFARQAGLNPLLRLAMAGLSGRIRRQARRLGVRYEFLLMRADGAQLRRIAELVDAGAIRPVVGATYAFAQTPQALRSLGTSHAHGKTVVSVP